VGRVALLADTDRKDDELMQFLDDGIPAALTLAQAARVLNLRERTVRGWAESGIFETIQVRPGAKRYVSRANIEALAERFKVTLDYTNALE
jgi:Helix-turn-helix domain